MILDESIKFIRGRYFISILEVKLGLFPVPFY